MEKREVLKTWELSLYELQRRPQEAVTNETEIRINPRTLHSELMCPICLDIMTNTMTTKECLHRFCSECIITALRNGNKECPTCRKKLVSKRSLRHDPNFDALISKICPSKVPEEQMNESSAMNSPVDSPVAATNNSSQENTDEQSAENSSRRKRSGGRSSVNQQDSSTENGGGISQTETPSSKALKREPSETNSTSKSNSKNSAVSSAPQNAPIDIVLRLKTEETSNSKSNDNENSNDESLSKTEDAAMCKYLKTSRDASIEHIVAYLKLRIEELKPFLVNSNQSGGDASSCDLSKLIIYAKKKHTSPPEYFALTQQEVLSDINQEYGLKTRPLELYFALLQNDD